MSSALVPNLNWAGDTSRPRYFQLRGIGELEQYQGAPNPSVGFLIDDIDFSGLGMAATMFDVDQMEVLRGPQATRYGANALAGLIYVTSAQPEDHFDSRIELGAGRLQHPGLWRHDHRAGRRPGFCVPPRRAALLRPTATTPMSISTAMISTAAASSRCAGAGATSPQMTCALI